MKETEGNAYSCMIVLMTEKLLIIAFAWLIKLKFYICKVEETIAALCIKWMRSTLLKFIKENDSYLCSKYVFHRKF
jgi:small-conductance mechanosensitive channel